MTLKDAAVKWFLQNAITKFLEGLKKDRSKRAMLSGYKTYITAAVIIILAILRALGIDIPGVSESALDIGAALGLIFARVGAKSEARKVESGL